MPEMVELMRVEQGDDGTFGVLRLDGEAYCVTLEPPDKGNAQNISCIPEGVYECRRTVSPRFGETFEVIDVPQRTSILFHAGNVVRDTRGCVLLGRHYGRVRGDRGVLSSGRTFSDFMARCEGVEEFPISISNVCKEEPWINFA